jgi:hypothetical protein
MELLMPHVKINNEVGIHVKKRVLYKKHTINDKTITHEIYTIPDSDVMYLYVMRNNIQVVMFSPFICDNIKYAKQAYTQMRAVFSPLALSKVRLSTVRWHYAQGQLDILEPLPTENRHESIKGKRIII